MAKKMDAREIIAHHADNLRSLIASVEGDAEAYEKQLEVELARARMTARRDGFEDGKRAALRELKKSMFTQEQMDESYRAGFVEGAALATKRGGGAND